MIWALKDTERILASPEGKKAICPLCLEKVLPKCGEIKIWHWAHKTKRYCDLWGEPETQWHLDWKNNFSKECQEVIIGNHRADVKTRNKVIEFQNSPISAESIREREEFYRDMVWMLNGKNFCERFLIKKKNGVLTFRWKHPIKSFFHANKPIYIHFDDEQKEQWKTHSEQDEYGNWYNAGKSKECEKMKRDIFLIKQMYPNIPCGGWGVMVSKNYFLCEVNYRGLK